MTTRPASSLLPVRSRVLGPEEDQFDVLARWVGEIAHPADSLLEIGAGDGDDQYFRRIRPLVGDVVGVDPDPYASGHDGLAAWYQASIEEFATRFGLADPNCAPTPTGHPSARSLPAHGSEPFDLALAVYVVEHITEPEGFFSAARACLRPGGSLFVVTPNLWHYFGLLAKASTALGIEDRLLGALRAARADHDQDGEHAAHFSVAYRANSVRALRKVGREAGFSALEIRHLENPAIFETYFPGRSASFPRWYSRSVHRLGKPALFGTLICRFVN